MNPEDNGGFSGGHRWPKATQECDHLGLTFTDIYALCKDYVSGSNYPTYLGLLIKSLTTVPTKKPDTHWTGRKRKTSTAGP